MILRSSALGYHDGHVGHHDAWSIIVLGQGDRYGIHAYCELERQHLAESVDEPSLSGSTAFSTRPPGARLPVLAPKSKPAVVVAKIDRVSHQVLYGWDGRRLAS